MSSDFRRSVGYLLSMWALVLGVIAAATAVRPAGPELDRRSTPTTLAPVHIGMPAWAENVVHDLEAPWLGDPTPADPELMPPPGPVDPLVMPPAPVGLTEAELIERMTSGTAEPPLDPSDPSHPDYVEPPPMLPGETGQHYMNRIGNPTLCVDVAGTPPPGFWSCVLLDPDA